MNLGDKKLTQKSPSYIIAEIGVNHGGSRSKCAILIKKASDAGADAVKLQIANPKESYSKKNMNKNIMFWCEITEIN